jgi:hypothetical protein
MSATLPTQLDRTYDFILRTFIERGDAPHHTEIGREFGVPPEEAKQLLRGVIETGYPAWLYPGTDLIASFAPFNNQPTQYRVTVEDRQEWYAQCGFESIALSWMFPGKAVRIDAPCLDCGEPLRIVVRDGVVEARDPETIVGYAALPFALWSKDWPFT